MKSKVEIYKIIKIFKWSFSIKVPDFLNPWEYTDNDTITFKDPPKKNEIVTIRRIK